MPRSRFDEPRLREWLRTGRIFALSHEGISYVPVYAFDSESRHPIAGLEPVVAVLKTQNDGWGMAYWFATPNNLLSCIPSKALVSAPERLLAAALGEVAEQMFG